MEGRRSRWLALGAAATSLGALAVLHAAGGTGPPLYDGLCVPPNYLTLGANPGPASASATYSASDLNQTQELATAEQQAPQAQMIIASGSFTVPPGATVKVTITPVAPPSARPVGGSIAGNVYRFAAETSTGQALDLAAGHPATIVLEAPSAGGPQLTLERFDGSSWTALKTFQSGCGTTEEAAAPALGMFALVAAGQSAGSTGASSGAAGSGGSSGPPVALIVVVVLVVLVALAIAAVRLSRRQRRPVRRRR